MLLTYVLPALETTIKATGSLLWLFARHPDQWALLRQKPELIDRAVNEGLRLEPPLPMTVRKIKDDVEFAGYAIPGGSQVMLVIGSANRDEARFPDPDRFDITRETSGHLGFGHSTHVCAGMNFAKAEISAILSSLVSRVQRIELIEARRPLMPVRGFDKLVMRLS